MRGNRTECGAGHGLRGDSPPENDYVGQAEGQERPAQAAIDNRLSKEECNWSTTETKTPHSSGQEAEPVLVGRQSVRAQASGRQENGEDTPLPAFSQRARGYCSETQAKAQVKAPGMWE